MDLNTFKTQTVKSAFRSAAAVGVSLSVLLTAMLSLPASAANEKLKVKPVAVTPASAPHWKADQIVVMPKKGLDKEELDQSIKDIDGKIIDKDLMGLAYLVEVPKGTLEKELAKAAKDKNFASVQHNHIYHANQAPSFGTTPNDPLFSQEFYLSQIGIQTAWTLGATGQGVVYGSLDTGVDFLHNQDLAGRTTGLLAGFGYQAFYNLPNGEEEELSFGHGSMTTNTFGSSTNNNFGGASGCFNSQIIPVCIIDNPTDASSNDFAIGRGVEFLMLNGCTLANLSFNADPPFAFDDTGTNVLLQNLFSIFAARGGVCFNSAGNSGTPDGIGVRTPGLVVVASVDANLVPSTFTVFGPGVQFAAPGENIVQTAYFGVPFVASGTSFSSPLCASVAGQVKSAVPSLTMGQVVSVMAATCQHPLDSQDTLSLFYGFGVPNAGAAVRLAQTSF
jgi:subtilisin family serine protease